MCVGKERRHAGDVDRRQRERFMSNFVTVDLDYPLLEM